jgi:hypothetical protein
MQQKAKDNNASLEDVVEITSELFLSHSKHFNDIKQSLSNISSYLCAITPILEQLSNPLYQILQEEENQNEKPTIS